MNDSAEFKKLVEMLDAVFTTLIVINRTNSVIISQLEKVENRVTELEKDLAKAREETSNLLA